MAAPAGAARSRTDGGTTTISGALAGSTSAACPLAAWPSFGVASTTALGRWLGSGAGAFFSGSATTIGPVANSGRLFSERSSAARASSAVGRFLVGLDDSMQHGDRLIAVPVLGELLGPVEHEAGLSVLRRLGLRAALLRRCGVVVRNVDWARVVQERAIADPARA